MNLEQTVERFRIYLSNENIFLNRISIFDKIFLKYILKSSVSIIRSSDLLAPKAIY